MSAVVSALRQVWRRLPMALRRTLGQAARRAFEPFLAARLPRAAPVLSLTARHPTVMGVFKAALGHGSAARLLMIELADGGYTPAAMDVTAEVGADANDQRGMPGAAAVERGPLILAVNPDTALVALAGREEILRNRAVIGYFVWELQVHPQRWVRIRPALHALWSPSRFAAKGLEEAFGMPVSVVPHPVGLAPPPVPTTDARARGRAILSAADDEFIALSSFSITSSLARKNPFGAIAAFEAAFGGSRKHRLVIRCLGGARYPTALLGLRRRVREAKANITLIDSPGGLDELHDLYAACDVLLSLHRSEGFGLNLAEAMLSQRAVIATAWSGNMDFMDATSAALVEYEIVDVKDPQGIYAVRGGQWAEPSVDSAVSQLRLLASDENLRNRIAAAGAAMARSKLAGGSASIALQSWTRSAT